MYWKYSDTTAPCGQDDPNAPPSTTPATPAATGTTGTPATQVTRQLVNFPAEWHLVWAPTGEVVRVFPVGTSFSVPDVGTTVYIRPPEPPSRKCRPVRLSRATRRT